MEYFGKSQTAKEETNKKTATEIMNLKITSAQIQSYTETQKMPTLQYLADKLCEDNEMQYVVTESKKQATLEKIEVGTAKSIFTKLKEYPYEFEIDSDLKLASINGVKIATTENNSNYEQLKTRIQVLEEKVKQYENLENTLQGLEERTNQLENQTIYAKRIQLLKEPFVQSVQGSNMGWVDGNFGNIELLKTVEDYKYLIIHYDTISVGMTEGVYEQTKLISVEELAFNDSDTPNWGNGSIFRIDNTFSLVSNGIVGWIKGDKKTIHIGSIWNNGDGAVQTFRIKQIYGI